MRLAELIHGYAECSGEVGSRAVAALTLDSRACTQGSVFCALQGTARHGLEFAASAIKNGATAVLFDPQAAPELSLEGAALVAVPQLTSRVGEIAARFYGNPAESLCLLGVTGTDGKSSVVNLWAQLMRAAGFSVASLGTLGLDCGDGVREGSHTTPDPIRLQADLARARDAGCTALAMEVSSHAIQQGRVSILRFDHVALTNLGRDHLDYHASVAEYHATKRRLLQWPGLQSAHLNGDEPLVRRMWEQVQSEDPASAARGVFYGGAPDARWRLVEAQPTHTGLQLQIQHGERSLSCAVPLFGEFNASNLMAAASLAEAAGASVDALAAALPQVRTVPGRMQALRSPQGPVVVVDYAHTPQALEAALKAVSAHRPSKLVCVFGCGGDRDRGKRPLMAAAAQKFADQIFLTDDNPRSEDPEQIFSDVRAGFRGTRNITAVHDRQAAIAQAIAAANATDIVLVAGKGHESYQLIGGEKRPFSDIGAAEAALSGVGA